MNINVNVNVNVNVDMDLRRRVSRSGQCRSAAVPTAAACIHAIPALGQSSNCGSRPALSPRKDHACSTQLTRN
ncbi:hypothetical protein F9278_45490 [Streptomyces phaeolivaceus]|uniref:Uncharacterized protein n=1 Tax=Streptomyces phaeolivaceus TaxID=2653200 RepID=A0A5P8KGS6_9ACTN|nr:hypothetical protein [Streptomyces phaeolivaceus]QFR02205.1 hypothetical protein F9278_45490 [Streptomyces phaeolivaceus]